ncbi:PREDICTED: uncharacterized protein LOC105367306 [Ceratosolen solmsi marchali]|uniref:Uncharacterized protein LOC105367306 n=1 Tax=Ceratosolen solmsi marchali TaxID=326594 RepID=A0AAJ7E1E0_9HYME|nr:PREDICTED: uncharacterized protein LOC105367306 [Ceratosolen solmsi marchali]
MEKLVTYIPVNSCLHYYLCETEFAPYIRTAGTVLLGWIIISWIWHIILMLCAPIVVSLLAIVLICPTTLDWFMCQMGPTFKSTTCVLIDKISSSINF